MIVSRFPFFISLILLVQGCGLFSNKNKPSSVYDTVRGNYVFADSFRFTDTEIRMAYILSDSAPVYLLDSSHRLVRAGILHFSDSIQVTTGIGMPYMNEYYTIGWHGQKAYIYGTDLGHRQTDYDYDGDGRNDQILYGYTDYDTSSVSDVIDLHPLWFRFISATGQRYELHDSGYSDVWFDELIDSSGLLFSKPTKVFKAVSGYQACSYPSFTKLIAISDGKPQIIHRHISNTDSGYGNYYDFDLPSVAHGHIDTISIVQHLNSQYADGSDSIVTTSLDSSIVYRIGDKWETKTIWKAPDTKDK